MEAGRAPGGTPIRVFVADNSAIHTQLIADGLKRDPDLQVILPVSDSSGLIAEVMASDVDVLVISASLDEQPLRGLEILQELRASFPGIRAVVLLHSSKRELVVDAFRVGARGLFSPQGSIEMLIKAVKCVHE